MEQLSNSKLEKSKAYYGSLYDSFRISVQVVLIFWAIFYIEKSVFGGKIDTRVFGVQPRTLVGLIGVFTSPFLHGDLQHLYSNSMPFIVLFSSLTFFYSKIAKEVTMGIYIMTGIGVWLFAREHHSIIGASGLVYGFAAFLFFSGVFRQNTPSLAISLAIIILYSGLIAGLFPKERISHEAHISGAFSGFFFAFFYRKVKVFDAKDQPKADPLYESQDGFYMMQNASMRYDYKQGEKTSSQENDR